MSDSTPTMLADRAIIRVSGDDVRSFLQGLVTNDTAGPLPVWAGLLTPQGKALFDFLLWEDGADVLIDCEAAQADALIRRIMVGLNGNCGRRSLKAAAGILAARQGWDEDRKQREIDDYLNYIRRFDVAGKPRQTADMAAE